jgi:flagellar motor switch protein FliM
MDGVPAVCGIRGPMSGVPPSEDDLAADWGAALEQEAAAMAAGPDGDTKSGAQTAADAGANPARLLSQSEIDSLLGFDGGPAHGGERSGIQRILEVGLVAYERLPMLEIVVDRLVRLLSTTLRNFTSDNVEVSVDSITSLRFSDYMDSVPLPAMLAVFRVEQWDNYGLVVADSALIYSVVDVLLGGRRGIAPMRVEGRPYTTIERTLIERLLGVVLGDLGTAFEPLAPATFRFERLEVNPRFAAISRPSNACVLVKLRLDMEDRGGRLELLLPHATLEPVRELLLQGFLGERFGRDSIWETHLAEELRHAEIGLDVVLDEQTMPLGSVLSLRVGDRIALGATPGAPVQLRHGEVGLFEGQFGRREHRLAVKIERALPHGARNGGGT